MPPSESTFSCALESLFWTLMASFPAVTPFPGSAMSGSAGASGRGADRDGAGGETLPLVRQKAPAGFQPAARNSNPGDSVLKVQCVI